MEALPLETLRDVWDHSISRASRSHLGDRLFCPDLWSSFVAFWSQHDKFSATSQLTVLDTLLQGGHSDQLPKDSKAQSLNRIHLCGPPLHTPLQTPWAPLLIIPHPPLINACLLQQVKPFQFEEGRNYVKEKCNYSGLQPASFRLKDEDSQKSVEKSQLIREVTAPMIDLVKFL